jgi:hypothetical protein
MKYLLAAAALTGSVAGSPPPRTLTIRAVAPFHCVSNDKGRVVLEPDKPNADAIYEYVSRIELICPDCCPNAKPAKRHTPGR